MSQDYLKFDITEAKEIVKTIYNLDGTLIRLDGEIDYNFKVETENDSYILKISRKNADLSYIKFQIDLLNYISSNKNIINSPKIFQANEGTQITEIIDNQGETHYVRLFSWANGRIYSSVNPKTNNLLFSLGEQAGKITNALKEFEHPGAHRKLEWDIGQADWIKNHTNLFGGEQQKIINYFLELFNGAKPSYNSMRKAVIHNDVNDNNIIVSEDLINPFVKSIIDYGDSIYTQVINDAAICTAYGIMNKADLLSASLEILKGYNRSFPILEDELELLYTLIAMRLVISVTKSAINKKQEPDNTYLQISENSAWDVLERWQEIDENLAYYSFRETCSFAPLPNIQLFDQWVLNKTFSLTDFFPSLNFNSVYQVDMSVSSTLIGDESVYNNNDRLSLKLKNIEIENPNSLLAGGYLETRPIYVTDAYKKEGNNGPEYRSTHLGIDFWVEPLTPIHSLLDGIVYSIHNNDNDKDYGPTIILEHNVEENFKFYTLYGHLSKSSLDILSVGQKVKKGELIGYVGDKDENGNWAPHLHFQIILDLLGNKHDFPGVAFANEINIWKSICPDPNLLFKESSLQIKESTNESELLTKRKLILGRSLSVSYSKPLHIVRGQAQYLIDKSGRKYLDTVNNVAHVGHEHPDVVRAAQNQIAVLNTNTRYLHENINEFADELLSTFPKELNVVHFVNSGSEANELALRMARTYTNQKDIIAIEVGYHGNTSGCVEVSSYKFDGKGGAGAPEFTHIVPLPDSYRGLHQGKDCGGLYSEYIKEQIKKVKSKGRNIAGFICESIISCGGQIELPEDYLNNAYNLIRSSGGICIADEVQVGCGRVGSHFWGFELYDVVPDIVTIGKPLGNGHPVAAVVCTKEIAEAFNNGMEYFNTFGGNPVSCAIGKKVLEVIKTEKLQENALVVGSYLKNELKKLQLQFPIIGDIRGQGLFLGFEFVDKNKTPQTEKAAYLVNRMRELAILMSTDGKQNNVIKIKPPMVFTKENTDELILRLTQVLKEDFMRLAYD